MLVQWEPYLFDKMMSGPMATPLYEGRPLIPAGAEPQFHRFGPRAAALGINMMGDVTRVPNSVISHALLDWAYEQRPEGQHQLQELVFQAYYTKNLFLGIDGCVQIAEEAGYDAKAAREHLEAGHGIAEVPKKAEANRESIISGIPNITFSNGQTVSGAQEPDRFKALILRAAGK